MLQFRTEPSLVTRVQTGRVADNNRSRLSAVSVATVSGDFVDLSESFSGIVLSDIQGEPPRRPSNLSVSTLAQSRRSSTETIPACLGVEPPSVADEVACIRSALSLIQENDTLYQGRGVFASRHPMKVEVGYVDLSHMDPIGYYELQLDCMDANRFLPEETQSVLDDIFEFIARDMLTLFNTKSYSVTISDDKQSSLNNHRRKLGGIEKNPSRLDRADIIQHAIAFAPTLFLAKPRESTVACIYNQEAAAEKIESLFRELSLLGTLRSDFCRDIRAKICSIRTKRPLDSCRLFNECKQTLRLEIAKRRARCSQAVDVCC